MALTPLQFLVSPSATATAGNNIITVTGNVDCSKVYSGTAVFIGNSQVAEAVSGTLPDGSGNSTITLRYNWPGVTTTSRMVAFNSIEGLTESIRRTREIINQLEELDGITSVTATADSIVKRDGSGRIKAATPSANDDVVIKGYLGTAAIANVSTSTTDTTPNTIQKFGDWGYTGQSLFIGGAANIDLITNPGKYWGYGGTDPVFSATGNNPWTSSFITFGLEVSGRFFGLNEYVVQEAILFIGVNAPLKKYRILGEGATGFGPWIDVASSANNGLIEYGSNANGHYTKLPGGTLISSLSINFETAAPKVITYPYEHITSAPIHSHIPTGNVLASRNLTVYLSSTVGATFALVSGGSYVTGAAQVTTIGKWK